jgi:hypothetical protein
MIKGLQGSPGIIVDGGNTSLPYVSQDQNNPMQGMVRVWGTELQVFNSGGWTQLSSSYATIRLDPETERLLNYVRKQQQEEAELRALISGHHHPAVELAQENLNKILDDLDRAKKQLKATVILSKEYEKSTS